MPLIRRLRFAAVSEGTGDPLTQDPKNVARRRIIVFAVLGIASYVVAMVATMPASVFLKNRPWRSGVAGTVWNGEVGIVGGTKIEWHWAPLRSLTSLGFAADWNATGPDTDLGGRLLARPGKLVLDKVSGAADAAMLLALQPSLPFTCAMTLQMEMERIVLASSDAMLDGTIRSDPGSCAPRGGGAATTLPPLRLTAEQAGDQSQVRITPDAQRRQTLIQATLAETGSIDISATPEGAQMMPFTRLPPGLVIRGTLSPTTSAPPVQLQVPKKAQ